MNRHRHFSHRRFHPSKQALLEHLPPGWRSDEALALLAYGLVVALGATAAVLILMGTPFAHVPMGI